MPAHRPSMPSDPFPQPAGPQPAGLRLLLQIAIVLLCWLAGALLVRFTGVPLSPGVAGFALLLVLLGGGWLPLDRIRDGADWLLSRMLVFFVPALLAVLAWPQLLGALGLRILVVIVGSTLAVMLTTLVVVRLARGRGARRPGAP